MRIEQNRRRGRAAMLLAKVITAGLYDIQRLAEVMVVSERTVALYRAGELEVPLERQACLALFLIDSVPSLTRQGHALLGQVQAAGRLASASTVTHLGAPVPNSRSY
jgi:hypothetical protein